MIRFLVLCMICLASSAAAVVAADAAFPVPLMNPPRTDVAPFKYVDVGKQIPNYTQGTKWGEGEPKSRMQKPLSPQESLKHVVVPRGFHVELFAAEPDLGGKPIAMNWDERGRLWVAETYDYPNELQPRGAGRDRIRICEDTDGDGRADKFTVFADKLSIPTSLLVGQGRAIVFDGTETVLLADRDGDDVADERRKLFGAWGQGDTHGGPSNMQYGLDNWVWAMQGYNASRLEVGAETHQFRQGFFRFRPDGSKLEFIRSTDNNTWGLGLSEEGLVFGSTANHNPSVFMPIANRYYEAVRGWTPSLVLRTIAASHLFHAATENVRQVDHFGGYTAAAGHSLYTARNYPREYWNRTALVCEPTGHLVGLFVLERDGSGFRSTNPCNLFASDDEWTAPIMAEVGPDGNVWVLDWYNFIVQHNPTPIGFQTGKGAAYETELRDKKHGRIYRVVYDGEAKQPAMHERYTLQDASPTKLSETLAHPNLFWRRHAQRILVERNERDVVPALMRMIRDPSVDALGLNVGAMHALWTLAGLGAFEGANAETTSTIVAALQHRSPGVRMNAVRVLPRSAESVSALLESNVLFDSDASVRLAALLAMADQETASGTTAPIVAAQIIKVLQDPLCETDPWLADAATCAAAKQDDWFLAALADVKAPQPKLLGTVRIVAEHRARGASANVETLTAALAKSEPQLAAAIVEGLAKGWPKDRPARLSPESAAQLEQAVARLAPERRASLVLLATRWGSAKFEKHSADIARALVERVGDTNLSNEERMQAARELVGYRPHDAEAAQAVLDQISPRVPQELAVALLRSLEGSEARELGTRLIAKLPQWTPQVRGPAVKLLLSRPAWTANWLDAAQSDSGALADLSLDQQRALADHPDKTLRRRASELLTRRSGLPNPDRAKVVAELLPLASEQGDIAAGKAVFLKQCAKCHVHGGEGQAIGPNLTGMAVHPKAELLANILDPSRSVEGNFRVYALATSSGQVISGLLAAETKTAVEIIDTEARKTVVLREEIESLTASTKSLMPEGFEKQLSRQELTDLLEFLAARGKYLPLPLEKAATVVSTRGMFNNLDASVERLIFADWKPKTFAGVPFQLVDPRQDRVPNAVVLFSPLGQLSATLPKSVSVPCQAPAGAIHLLGGISGWGHPLGTVGSVSLIVRLHYQGSETEDHPLLNGKHYADYIRRVDVADSQFAFDLAGRQLRYLSIKPQRSDTIERIEFIKGPDDTAPVVLAVTIEAP